MKGQAEQSGEMRLPAVRNLRPRISQDETARDELSRIDELEKRLEEISKQLRQQLEQNQPGLHFDERFASLTSEAQAAVNEAAETLRKVAGIELPEDRTQLFLRATDVYRLQEYSEDETYFLALASLSGGAALGVLVNWATAENITLGKAGWIAFIVFVIVTLVFVGFWIRAHRRGMKLKASHELYKRQ